MATDEELFSALPWCLRNYIDEKGWPGFRDVQRRAFGILSDSDDHLLISAGTSSGKTEAALFPVISDLCRDRPRSISALYVSPLIALIDDQNDRVSRMLRDSDVDLYPWHGDISASIKRRVMERGRGILQITPESLENIVNRNFRHVPGMFGDLRYVIIDEVHTFMNSDRGLHLLCELEAIERLSGASPRRIGLSATLSDYGAAASWLRAGTGRSVSLVECPERPGYDLTVTFDHIAPKGSEERDGTVRARFRRVFDTIDGHDCIVFANNREGVESAASALKAEAAARGSSEGIWAHHSSVSKEYRKLAEERMRDPAHPTAAVATSTLELGIDIGDLSRVVQLNAPNSVSSLVQKLGRSGRRNGRPVISVSCTDEYGSGLPEGMFPDVVKAVAEAELLGRRWIEPVRFSRLPYSLLFQQTLAFVNARVAVSFRELRDGVLSMHPFGMITKDEYQLLLRRCCEEGVLDWNGGRSVFTLGDRGSGIVRRPDFSGIFRTMEEFDVFHRKERIGSVQELPSPGDLIQLAGSPWSVESVDLGGRSVHVVSSAVCTETRWRSGYGDTHTCILKQMKACLEDDAAYGYLSDDAAEALASSRRVYSERGLGRIVVEDGDGWSLYPWLGTVQFDTLYRVLLHLGVSDGCRAPFSIGLDRRRSLDEIRSMAASFAESADPSVLVTDDDIRRSMAVGKYSRFIPEPLLRREFLADRIDLGFTIGRRRRSDFRHQHGTAPAAEV